MRQDVFSWVSAISVRCSNCFSCYGAFLRFTCIALGASVLFALAACAPASEKALAYVNQAQRMYDAGDLRSAKLEAKNALQIEPKNPRARFILALVAEQEGDYKALIGNLQLVVDVEPDNADARVRLGRIYYFLQATEEAEKQLAAARKLDPDGLGTRILEAQLQLKRQEYAASSSNVEFVLAKDPLNGDGLYIKSLILATTDSDKAIRYIRESVLPKVDKELGATFRELLVSLLTTAQRWPEVEQELQSLAAEFPAVGAYRSQLLDFYKKQGGANVAEDYLRKLANAAPDDVSVQLGLVSFLQDARGRQAALEALEAQVAQFPKMVGLQMALGRLYEQNGEPAKALVAYRAVAKLDPTSKIGFAARASSAAVLATQDGKFAEAERQIEAILAEQPDNSDALLVRAGLNRQKERWDDVIADLRLVVRQRPNDTQSNLMLARSYLAKNELSLAADEYRRILLQDALHAEAANELATLLVQQGDFSGAEAVFRKRLELAPDDLDAASRFVAFLIRKPDLGMAEQEARKLAAMAGQGGRGEFALGQVMMAQGRFVDAAAAYRRAVELRPGDTLPLEGLAKALTLQGQIETLIKFLDDTVSRQPDHLVAKLLLGRAQAAQGNTVVAQQTLRDLISWRPEFLPAYVELALTQKDQKDRIKTYRQGLSIVPGNPELGLRLGSELESAGLYDQALMVYEELVAVNPDWPVAVNNLVALMLDHKKDQASMKKALELASRFRNSDSSVELDTLGWAYYRNNDFIAAVQFLERAVSMSPDNAILRYHLGMAYIGANNSVGARTELQSALRIGVKGFEGDAVARQALSELLGT